MSATAFQRMRREAAAIKLAEEVKEKEIQEDIDNTDFIFEDDDNLNEDECSEKPLTEMTLEELIEYAETNEIDTGKATSQAGILEKIIKSQTE